MAISDDIRSYNNEFTGQKLVETLLQGLNASAVIKTETGVEHLNTSKNILSILEKIDSNLEKELKDVSSNIALLVKTLENCCARTSNTGSQSNQNSSQTKQNSVQTGQQSSSNVPKGLNTVSVPGGGSGPRNPNLRTPGGANNAPINANLGRMGQQLGVAILAGLGDELIKVFAQFKLTGRDMLSGVITDSLKFNQNMRQVMYSTEGTGVALTSLENKYLAIGLTTKQTGMFREKMQHAYMKSLQEGLTLENKGGKLVKRNAKDQQKMTMNSLRTATVVGTNAEETASMFSEWNRQIGLTNSQMATLGRSMELIARETGVTGDNLLEAAKASQQTIMSVRNFSGINERAMAQIIEMQASTRKFGVEGVGNEINTALAGGFDTILSARPQIVAMMARAASEAGLALGSSILSNAGQTKRFYQSMSNTLLSQVQNATGMHGDIPHIMDQIERLQEGDVNAQARAGILLTQIKASTGLGIGEIYALNKSNKESTKTFEEKMAELDGKLINVNAGTAEHKSLSNKKRDLSINQTSGDLSTFVRRMQTAQGATLEDKMRNASRGTKIDPKNLGQTVNQHFESLRDRAHGAGKDFNQLLAESGYNKKLVLNDLNSGDASKMDAAISALQEADNKVVIAEASSQDPITQALHELTKVNDYLRSTMERLSATLLSVEIVIGAAIAAFAFKAGGSLLTMGVTGAAAAGGFGGGGFGFGTRGGVPGGGGPGGGPRVRRPTGNPANRASMPRRPMNTTQVPRAGGGRAALLGALFNYGPAVLGAATGAYAGSQMGEGGLANMAMGAAGGAAVGHLGRNLMGGGMEGMPGFGQQCVPVCIVSGLGGVESGLGALDLAATGAGAAADVRAARGAAGAGKAAAGAAKASWTSRIFGERAGQMASNVGNKASQMASAVGNKTGQMASGVGNWASRIPGAARVGQFASGIGARLPSLGTAGAAAGRFGAGFLRFLGPVVGALNGASQSLATGRSMTESTILGALTGDAETGSAFSGLLRIPKGSAKDEMLGIGGAAAGGAMSGAAIGNFVPVVGTALGAAIGGALGAGGEIYKILTKEDSPLRKWAFDTAGMVGTGFNESFNTVSYLLQGKFSESASSAWKAIQTGGSLLGGAFSILGSTVSGVLSFATFGLTDVIGGWAGSAMSMIGGILSNVKDMAVGIFSEVSDATGLTWAGKKLGEGAHAAGAGIYSAGEAILSYLPSWDKGTSNVEKSGMALIHEGEAVVPASLIKSLAASGSPFPNIESGIGGRTGSSGLFEGATSILSGIGSGVLGMVSPVLGMVSPVLGMVSPAIGLMNSLIGNKSFNSLIEPSSYEGKTKIGGSSNNIENLVAAMDSNTLAEDIKKSMSAIGSGLFSNNNIYETDVMARDTMSNLLGGSLIGSTIPMFHDKSFKAGSNSTKSNYLTEDNDYGETINNQLGLAMLNKNPIKGSVATSSLTAEDAEEYVARQVEGSKPQSAFSGMLSMDSIFEYLTINQAAKLDEMINLLSQIKDKSGNPLMVNLGEKQSGSPSQEHSGIKNWAKDKITGAWPLQQGSFQSTSNNTGDV